MIGVAARLTLLIGAAGLASSAQAHTAWSTGMPVPEWVRNACCGPSDTHHLTPSQVHRAPGGHWVDGVQALVPWAKTLPSQDGDYWIFYRDFSDGTQYVFCFFAPPEGAGITPTAPARAASARLGALSGRRPG